MSEPSESPVGFPHRAVGAAGWLLLGLVLLSWVALLVWAATDPCIDDCGDLGRTRAAVYLGIMTLPGVPLAGSMLLVSRAVYRRGSAIRLLLSLPFGAFAGLALLAAVFAAGTALGTVITRVTLIGDCSEDSFYSATCVQWRRTVSFGLMAAGWFGMIGATSWLFSKRAFPGTRGSSASVANLVLGVVLASAFLLRVGATAGQRPMAFFGTAPSLANEQPIPPPEGDPALLAPEEEEPYEKPTLVKILPARQAGHKTGYRFSNLRVTVEDIHSPPLGLRYRVRYDVRWTEERLPRDQTCTYTFFGKHWKVVHFHTANFGFGHAGDARSYTGLGIDFFDSHFTGEPRWMRMNCKDDGRSSYPLSPRERLRRTVP